MTSYPARTEQVVLLDEDGRARGTADKQTVHHAETPLHLAFSCYIFDPNNALLVTQRALHKVTFPGVWTNSVCGHPAPGEQLAGAVRRRAGQELGLELDDVRPVLPAFRYRAVMANGVAENEMCPVFVARTVGTAAPDPAEVAGWEWVSWSTFRDTVLDGSRDVSPWCVDQVRELVARGADPDDWPTAPDEDLPPAARSTGTVGSGT